LRGLYKGGNMAFGLSPAELAAAGVDPDGYVTRKLAENKKMLSVDQMEAYVRKEFVPLLAQGFDMQPQDVVIFRDPNTYVSAQLRGLTVMLYTDGKVMLSTAQGLTEAGNISELKKGIKELIEARIRELTQHQ